jgi:hypothetical protein
MPRRLWPALLVGLLSVLLSAELFAHVWLRHVVGLDWAPEYAGGTADARLIGEWRVPHETWGNWHKPNARARHEAACFSVALESNAEGARDRPRGREGTGRILVLGDSFVEGTGVAAEHRFTDVLEAQLGREVLNFGAATHGPLQYQLVYEDLARHYAHAHVLVLLLAYNDFTDNDWDWPQAKSGGARRYRPYYQATDDGAYRAIYPPRRREADGIARAPGTWDGIARAIRRNSWALRAGEHLGAWMRGELTYSGYYDATDAQLAAVMWSLARIRDLAGDRAMTVAIAPREHEIARARAAGPSPMVRKLAAFGAGHGIGVIDLLPALAAAGPERLYLPCDGHWNEAGHRAAAAALLASGRFGPARP